MDLTGWLAGLKEGDEVCIQKGWYFASRVTAVERVTMTQIIADGGMRFNRHSGVRIGGSGRSRSYITLPTQEIKDKIERIELIAACNRLTYDALTLDQLRRIVAIIQEGKE